VPAHPGASSCSQPTFAHAPVERATRTRGTRFTNPHITHPRTQRTSGTRSSSSSSHSYPSQVKLECECAAPSSPHTLHILPSLCGTAVHSLPTPHTAPSSERFANRLSRRRRRARPSYDNVSRRGLSSALSRSRTPLPTWTRRSRSFFQSRARAPASHASHDNHARVVAKDSRAGRRFRRPPPCPGRQCAGPRPAQA
jgi:hypothetical protein